MRVLIAISVAAMVLFAAGCTAGTTHPAASPAPPPPDPYTASALLKIAASFNHDYDTGDYAPVYTRWDAHSQAILTRADYIRRPELAEGSSGTAVKQAQCELNWAYAYAQSTNYGNGSAGGLTVDGSFGAYTNEATRNFQACVHIAVDGVIGPNTWSKLNYWVNQSTYACAAP